MRFGRFADGQPRVCVAYDDYALDLRAVTEDPDVLAFATDVELRERMAKLVRGRPPSHFLRRQERVEMLAPVEPRRVILAGGAEGDWEPTHVLGPGAELPAGDWYTGVAAVVARDVERVGQKWESHIAGYTTFHAVEGHLCLGPWLADLDEASDMRLLTFSAFVDDLSRIRPAKALLDWGGVMREAHSRQPLRAGDLVCLSAPAQQAEGPIRSSLVYDGRLLSRLTATLAAGDATTADGGEGNPASETEAAADAEPAADAVADGAAVKPAGPVS